MNSVLQGIQERHQPVGSTTQRDPYGEPLMVCRTCGQTWWNGCDAAILAAGLMEAEATIARLRADLAQARAGEGQ